jgi:CPA1 family monovalent cation:H+ antiporter
MSIEIFSYLLIVIAVVLAITTKMRSKYYIPILVIVSVAISRVGHFDGIGIVPKYLLEVLLPPLLFESSINIKLKALTKNLVPVITFALVGTASTLAIVAVGAHFLLGLPWLVAAILASALTPTDPPAVIAIMKEFHAPADLEFITEGESLLNDGVAVVFFLIFAGLLGGHAEFTLGHVAEEFVHEAVFGVLIGASLGAFLGYATKFFDHLPLELLFTIVASISTYQLAESAGCSGVLAVVASGVAMRNMADKVNGWSPMIDLLVKNVWGGAASFCNGIIFLLVGFHIGSGFAFEALVPALIITAVLVVGRFFSIYALSFGLNVSGVYRMQRAWQDVLAVGGLTGGLGIAMLLTLPVETIGVEIREFMIQVALWVVLISLTGRAFLIKPTMEWHDMIHGPTPLDRYNDLTADVRSSRGIIKGVAKAEKNLGISLVTRNDDGSVRVDNDSPELIRQLKLAEEAEIAALERRKALLQEHPNLREQVLGERWREIVVDQMNETMTGSDSPQVKDRIMNRLAQWL